MRLDYLYSLTVADINATNPTLWNDWRATLLQQLYTQTRDALRRGLESPADKAATVAAFQERALESMPQLIPMPRITQIWGALGSDFFLRHSPAQIATLTMDLANHDEAAPFVKTENYHSKLVRGGATRVYVYTPDRPRLFADAVTSLSQLGLRIVEAAIHTGANGYCMDMFTVLAQDGSHLAQDDPIHGRIVKKLKSTLARDGKPGSVGQKRVSRQMRELQHPTEVSIVTGPGEDSSTLTVVASDRPGLLAIIAEILVDLGVQVLSARIATLGERVEDLFQVRNQHDQPIAPGQDAYELSNAIRQRIDHALSA